MSEVGPVILGVDWHRAIHRRDLEIGQPVIVQHPKRSWMDVLVGVAGGAMLVGEGWAIVNKVPGDTISERTRYYFRIKGKGGTFVFLAFFGTFSAWFSAHIIKRPEAPNI